MNDEPLWIPSQARIDAANLAKFRKLAENRTGRKISDYAALHDWSIEPSGEFWSLLWDYSGIVGDKGERILSYGDRMPGAEFFPDARLNFAESFLQTRGTGDALVFWGEEKVKRRLTWDNLNALVSRLQQLFVSHGVKKGDRVAAMMPNMPETIACMLAAASLGAIWSSCSPDFGEQGVLDRFGQIEPVLFIAVDGYWYSGKKIDVSGKVATIAAGLPTAKNVLIVDYLGDAREVARPIAHAQALDTALASIAPKPVTFERLPFNHPVYILFSSGTTGIPKCIVHSAGGVLLQHIKEHRLHAGLNRGDRLFYFTTCGWMMWNWLVSGLASGISLMLYDGSPFYPNGEILFDYADSESFTYFGTSAKFIDTLRKSGLEPISSHSLATLRTLSSTGSPLSPEGFSFVYSGIKHDLHLASISGGTDLCACFVIGAETLPVWSGEIQVAGLGMAVDVWGDDGHTVRREKGELVCARPFPSMPIGFWNDPGNQKYHAAYFERFPNVWCHGDFAEWTEHGGVIIHGRSDATLNPGGVRIGTAEIYNQVEQMEEVLESLAIGQDFDGDTRIILFVRLQPGRMLDEELAKRIKSKIRVGASPRHVPAKILAIADIPRTKSGKITELAVREVVHGRPVKNKEALANPEALDLFQELSELRS
jgi:acetoacetyl-CoA synthetase